MVCEKAMKGHNQSAVAQERVKSESVFVLEVNGILFLTSCQTLCNFIWI